jgi:hypothetical protein
MGVSFSEKSVWLTLAVIVVGFGFYFSKAAGAPALSAREAIGLIVGVAMLTIVAEIVLNIALAISDRRIRLTGTAEPVDERDRLIRTKAARNAYFVLMVGVFAGLGQILLTGAAREVLGAGEILPAEAGAVNSAHVLVGAVLLAEITKLGSQAYYYRRGA